VGSSISVVAALLFCYIVYDGLTNHENLLSENERAEAEYGVLYDGKLALSAVLLVAKAAGSQIPGFSGKGA